MTAPGERAEHGADDQWAAELDDWITNGYSVVDPSRRTSAVHDVDDACLCDHRFGDHYKAEPDRPVRCARCTCIRYRDRAQHEHDREVAMERAIEDAAAARADLAAELRGDIEED